MEQILTKLSPYNLFNYLIPGVVFTIILKIFTDFDLTLKETFSGLVIYYFFGMCISRVGSIVLQPILKRMGVYKEYDDNKFVKASLLKKDPMVELFFEVANTYRTFSAMFLVLSILKIINVVYSTNTFPTSNFIFFISVVLLFILFVAAFHKQNKRVISRIDATIAGIPDQTEQKPNTGK